MVVLLPWQEVVLLLREVKPLRHSHSARLCLFRHSEFSPQENPSEQKSKPERRRRKKGGGGAESGGEEGEEKEEEQEESDSLTIDNYNNNHKYIIMIIIKDVKVNASLTR